MFELRGELGIGELRETYKLITTSESTSPSTPPYPFLTTSSHTSPSRTLLTNALQSELPNACFPSSGSSSTTAFKIVRYKLQTFIRVVRDALAIGAGSFVSSGLGGVMTGRIVERDSGSRRVRKSVEDWRYIFEICDEVCRDEVLFDRDEIEEVRSCDEDNVSRVGARVVETEPVEVMVLTPLRRRIEERKGEKRGTGMKLAMCLRLADACRCCCSNVKAGR
jgi:hypothetical protein